MSSYLRREVTGTIFSQIEGRRRTGRNNNSASGFGGAEIVLLHGYKYGKYFNIIPHNNLKFCIFK